MKTTYLLLLPLLFTAGAGFAQQQHQPYAAQEARAVKALSPEEVAQYLAGAGMGYARAAELNHFPGPMHVLELADKLDLSEHQLKATRALMEEHKAHARAVGAKLVAAEQALEQLFRSGKVEAKALASATRAAADLQGEYRLSHLDTHLKMRALLTEQQVENYDALRGYSDRGVTPGRGHSHKH